jgi:asparagine synthase (glutamine-hydrolysing)
VAVAFSGGLDSSIVAKCAMKLTGVVGCTAYAENSRDATRAKEAAEELGLPLAASELDLAGVEGALSTMNLPFAPTLMDKSLWCLYSAVAQSARKEGARVLLLGQLADELFGGYAKYAEALKAQGQDAAGSMMRGDVQEYAQRGRARDVGACRGLVEPRFPFEASGLMAFAESLPVSFKIRGDERKAVLRRAALILGVPEGIAKAPKKAAQYSSGVQKLLAGSHF